MTSLAIQLSGLEDDELEDFVELWAAQKSKGYHKVYRVGASHDKGRDVVAYLGPTLAEGPWHLYQCKRKKRGVTVSLTEGLVELAKMFYHHQQGQYKTLPTKYIFVAPRGFAGSFQTLLENPTSLRDALIDKWEDHCARAITETATVSLTPELRSLIAGYDFSQVDFLNTRLLVQDPASGAALIKLLNLPPQEAPRSFAPDVIQPEEAEYIDQLRQVYAEAAGADFDTADDVLADERYGAPLKDERTRFFDAAGFKRFHRDNTPQEALAAFQEDVYLGVIGIHRRSHASRLDRVDAVIAHASIVQAGLIGTTVRVAVKQGMCHHFVNERRMTWVP